MNGLPRVPVNGVDGKVTRGEELAFTLLNKRILLPQLGKPGVPDLLTVGGETGRGKYVSNNLAFGVLEDKAQPRLEREQWSN